MREGAEPIAGPATSGPAACGSPAAAADFAIAAVRPAARWRATDSDAVL